MLGEEWGLWVLSFIHVVESDIVSDQCVKVQFLKFIYKMLCWRDIFWFSLLSIDCFLGFKSFFDESNHILRFKLFYKLVFAIEQNIHVDFFCKQISLSQVAFFSYRHLCFIYSLDQCVIKRATGVTLLLFFLFFF